MEILLKSGRDDLANVYIAKTPESKYIEFVESIQPPYPKKEKWVLIVSTLFGCPVGCSICDAGGWYKGKLTQAEIEYQIDYLIRQSFPDGKVNTRKFKIQFSRMGEPALNPAVLDVLDAFPHKYDINGFIPSISTVAPMGFDSFFERLRDIKNRHYRNGQFQLQFSVHATSPEERDRLIPIRKWNLDQIAHYGNTFFETGDRKITLNFALSDQYPIDPDIISKIFNPEHFLIKLTPVNPTISAEQNQITNGLKDIRSIESLPSIQLIKKAGFQVLISIGELEENKIGSNCGQYIKRFLNERGFDNPESYSYPRSGFDSKVS